VKGACATLEVYDADTDCGDDKKDSTFYLCEESEDEEVSCLNSACVTEAVYDAWCGETMLISDDLLCSENEAGLSACVGGACVDPTTYSDCGDTLEISLYSVCAISTTETSCLNNECVTLAVYEEYMVA